MGFMLQHLAHFALSKVDCINYALDLDVRASNILLQDVSASQARASEPAAEPRSRATYVLERIAADILGHEKQTMTYGLYSGGSSLQQKRDTITRSPTLPTPAGADTDVQSKTTMELHEHSLTCPESATIFGYSLTDERGIHVVRDPSERFVQAHTNHVSAVVEWDCLRTNHSNAYWLANGSRWDERMVIWTSAAAYAL